MFSEAAKVEIKAYVWNACGEPTELKWDGKDEFDPIQSELRDVMEHYEYGRIEAVRGDSEPVVLWYRAFTDPFRGRQTVSGTDGADLNRAYLEHKNYCALQVFSPAELYNLRPSLTDTCATHVIEMHIPEVDRFRLDHSAIEDGKLFETRMLVSHSFDGRRTWELATVWFDGRPVMVVNSSGRDGDEYHERWITDGEQYGKLVTWLNTFTEHGEVTGYVKPDTVIPAMTEFYGSTIHDFYDVAAQQEKKK